MEDVIETIYNEDITLPRLLARNFQQYGDKKTALLKKDLGIWQEYTWKDYYEQVKRFSLCLISLGLQPGDKVAIIGDNDPEWWIAELAVLSSRAIALGIYPDCSPSEVCYMLNHSDSKFIVARDQEQCDKILQIKDELPNLLKVFYWDPKGMRHYSDSILCSFDEALEMSKEYEKHFPNLFEDNLSKGKADDVAVFCYTSGTTGLPKAAMLNQRGLLLGGLFMSHFCQLQPGDHYFSFLSPAWATEQVLGIASTLYFVAVTCFAENTDTLRTDMREIGPRVVFYGSRQWENIVSDIEVGIIETSLLKRLFYRLFIKIGYKISEAHFEKKKCNLLWNIIYKVGDWLVLRQIRDYLGLRKLQVGITAGTYLGPDVIKFFRALGIFIYNMYGLTEALAATAETPTNYKLGSGGKVSPGVKIKIDYNGEVFIRGKNVFNGYYKEREKTEEVLKDGWFCTGDAGYIDEEGYFFYLDRVKEMAVMKNGTRFSPTYIESALKFSLYIKDVMVIGADREYIVAFINIDFATVGKWAEKHHISYSTYTDLSQKREVYDLIHKEIEAVNIQLPKDNKISKFINFYKEFDADEGELTRTRKIKRTFMGKRYKQIIDAIYEGRTIFNVSDEITYRDGRKGKIETEITICSC